MWKAAIRLKDSLYFACILYETNPVQYNKSKGKWDHSGERMQIPYEYLHSLGRDSEARRRGRDTPKLQIPSKYFPLPNYAWTGHGGLETGKENHEKDAKSDVWSLLPSLWEIAFPGRLCPPLYNLQPVWGSYCAKKSGVQRDVGSTQHMARR